MQWFSTQDVVRLLADHYPVRAIHVRAWCEEGSIPPEYAKRTPSPQGRGQWRIAARAVPFILRSLLELSADEIKIILAKNGLTCLEKD